MSVEVSTALIMEMNSVNIKSVDSHLHIHSYGFKNVIFFYTL